MAHQNMPPGAVGGPLVVGVDGWSGGWVAVVVVQGRFHEALYASTFRDLLSRLERAAVIAVDIPIGLPAEGTRRADVEARRFLGGQRRSSVFIAPPREVLQEPTYAGATMLSRSRHGRGVSRQSYALRSKILEVDEFAPHDSRIIEAHPEVSFAALAGQPLEEPKKSWNGQMRRRQMLVHAGITLPDDLGAAGVVPVDDLLDAAAAAWTAARHERDESLPLPTDPDLDDRGRPMTIWR